jgi:hypothetical protein
LPGSTGLHTHSALGSLGDLLDLLAPARLIADLLERLGGITARGLSRTVRTSPPNCIGAEASTVTLSLIRLFRWVGA